jgi:hypothetical protein
MFSSGRREQAAAMRSDMRSGVTHATECREHDRCQRNPRAMEPRPDRLDAHAVRKIIDAQPGTVIPAELA